MNPNGIQDAAHQYKENRDNLVEFEDVYDMEKAQQELAPYLSVIKRKDFESFVRPKGVIMSYDVLHIRENPKEPKWFIGESDLCTNNRGPGQGYLDVLQFNCAFFSIAMANSRELYDLYWSVDNALHFSPLTLQAAEDVIAQVRIRSVARGGRGYFNALHIRAEEDWHIHCRAWETQDPWATEPRDNCYSNTDIMLDVLGNEGLKPHLPLFIAGVQLAKATDNPVIKQLNQSYDLIDKDVYLTGLPDYKTARDLLATVDFAIVGAADTFVGNSVSTFSALMLLHRHRERSKSQGKLATAGNRYAPLKYPEAETNFVLAYSCYVDRYRDVFNAFCPGGLLTTCKWEDIQWHWQTYGAAEGRTLQCDTSAGFHYNGGNIPLGDVLFGNNWAKPVESPSAVTAYYCYVDRYPDIYTGFCNNVLARCQWNNIVEHWKVFGASEGRTRDCNVHTSAEPASQAPPLRKWVFTITGDSPAYDEMIRVAVMSALQYTSLIPIALVTGAQKGARIIPWLERQGVRIVFHTPEWKPAIIRASEIAVRLGHHKDKSPLYGDPTMLLATFLRLDLAMLGFVDDYVLYADVDIVFTGDVKNEDFGPTMPQYFTMGVEMEPDMVGRIFGNAGVLLLNCRGMRRTYKEMIKWVFSEENIQNGLHFGDFGPGDQGALKAFYWEHRLLRPWSRFNWKPYWGFAPDAKIVHFHGPKPIDYLNYYENQTKELAKHRLYGGIYDMCKADLPVGEEVPAELLAGRGCTQYIALWAHLAHDAQRTAPFALRLPDSNASNRTSTNSTPPPVASQKSKGSFLFPDVKTTEVVPVGWLWILQCGNLVAFGAFFCVKRSCPGLTLWPSRGRDRPADGRAALRSPVAAGGPAMNWNVGGNVNWN